MIRTSARLSNSVLTNGARSLLTSGRVALGNKISFRTPSISSTTTTTNIIGSRRFISTEPEQKFTKLSDSNDANRDTIFKYTWGTWLTNDKLEKTKRMTKFSIEGLTDVVNSLYDFSKKNLTAIDTSDLSKLPSPVNINKQSITILPNNATISNLDVLNANEPQVYIKTVTSIHEGKHHRVYKLSTNIPTKQLVLRIPYMTDSIDNISKKMQSEIATQDFIQNKLGINVPKVFAYGLDGSNPLGIPFMIQEFIDGELLMKSWDPLLDDESNGQPRQKLVDVIECVSEIHSKLVSMDFNGIGSLYFKHDLVGLNKDIEIETIDNRWSIGPIIERNFWKNKKSTVSNEHLGPWKANELSSVISNLAQVELDNVNTRLSIIEAGSSSEPEKSTILKEQRDTFENVIKIAPSLFKTENNVDIKKKIPNLEEMIKPRLYLPDLDPMNIIMNSKDTKPYLLDFENTCIKPFILQNSPKFIEYEGPKIYNIKTEIPDFDKLKPNEKAQCEFIYKRTRNQFLWEDSLNKRQPTLITSMAPPMKLLRSPYIAMMERKSDDGYLIIDENLLQLRQVWEDLYKNHIVSDSKFPLVFTKEQVEKHVKDINELHQKLVSTPFAATQGWVPQDMFDKLLKDGIIVEGKDGNYTINAPAPTNAETKA